MQYSKVDFIRVTYIQSHAILLFILLYFDLNRGTKSSCILVMTENAHTKRAPDICGIDLITGLGNRSFIVSTILITFLWSLTKEITFDS